MKRTLSLIALATVAAVAGPLKVGADVSGALVIPSFDPSTGITAKVGFGGKVAPAMEYALNEQLSIRGSVGYQLLTYGAEFEVIDIMTLHSEKLTVDYTTQFLTIDGAIQYAFTPQAYGAIGVGYDINLSSKGKLAGTTSSDPDKSNPFLISAGLGYKISPELALNLGYQFPLTPLSGGDFKIKAQTVNLGVRYDIGL